MVAMGLRTGCGKEAVMVAALMAEDFCMLADVGRRIINFY